MSAHMLATSARYVIVEQLNASQWHASCPCGDWRTGGVQDYVGAVADALWMAAGRGLGVETLDLGFNRKVLLKPEVR